MSNRPYAVDRLWSDEYIPQLRSVLKALLPYCVEINIAPAEMDNKEATDLLINSTIACRLRKPSCTHRDFTLRVHRDSGHETELAKIKRGHAERYFYGWTDKNHNIVQWIFVDLGKLRASGLLDIIRSYIPNGDGTYFIAITIKELYKAGCIIATHLTNLKVTSIIPDKREWTTLSFVPRHRLNKKSCDKYNGSLWQPLQQQDLWEVPV